MELRNEILKYISRNSTPCTIQMYRNVAIVTSILFNYLIMPLKLQKWLTRETTKLSFYF